MTEGNTGTKQLTFTLTLDKAPTSDVTVSYETVAGTATAGEDFVAKTGTVTFKAGQQTATVNVDVNGDYKHEGNETLKLKITGSSLSAAAEATGTIVNDDDLLTANVSAVNEGGTVLFTLESLSPNTTFTYVLSGLDAADLKSGSLTNTVTTDANGKAVIQIDLAADAKTEGAETLTLSINNQSVDVTVNDTSTTPVVWNISAEDIAKANADGVPVC